MTTTKHLQERREFGRRTVFLHGWICVEGRPKLPCLVRDLSVAGARLELDMPASWLPYRFRLVIDTSRFASDCEIKHHNGRNVGVSFIVRQTILEPIKNWTVDDVLAHKGHA